MTRNIRNSENLHILLWLIKDTFWCLTLKTPGLIMIIPTLSLAIYITWKTKETYSELMHNLAICCWISANSIWMIGEFFFEDGLRNYAIVFFIIGLIIIGFYYGKTTMNYLKTDKKG